MVDHLSPEQRHQLMSNIRDKNTTPELVVRKTAHSLGFRFRLHRKDLPGKPDLVFPKYLKLIFVNGCFWHFHKCKTLPKTNPEYWQKKFKQNQARDKKNKRELKSMGWTSLVIWECETRKPEKLKEKIVNFLYQARKC